jgi:hypothetical protein
MDQIAVHRIYHRISFRPIAVGLIASLALLLFYLGLVSLISRSWRHALALLTEGRLSPLTMALPSTILGGYSQMLASEASD